MGYLFLYGIKDTVDTVATKDSKGNSTVMIPIEELEIFIDSAKKKGNNCKTAFASFSFSFQSASEKKVSHEKLKDDRYLTSVFMMAP